jgi:ATPase family AAA domain-containing protein 3A/B
MNAVAAQHATEREKVMWEQQRKLETQRAEQNAQLKQYEDELARKRQQAENEAARARNAELVKMQEQAAERAEALRRDTEKKIQMEKRATEEFKAKLEQENTRAKAIAEAEGRTLENRQNEDVIRRQMLAKVEAETTKAIKVVQEGMVYFGRGATELLSNPQQMTMLVGGLSLLAAGVYSSREGAKFGFKQLEKYLGQPSLIRETSRGAFWKPQSAGANILGDVQLEKSMETRVKQLATATANTRARKAPFRNILLYGPPGTGKTMAAKRLARHSGLDYALMTGGDVAPLGASAVTKIHEMFDWAGTSRKGLLLFIDEADAFLAKRGGNVASQETRSALNALLYRTGEMSRDVTLVMATNRPEDLDSAVLDRVDETMEFALPDEETRFRLVKQYFDKLIVRGADPGDEQPSRTFLGGIMKTLGFGKIPDRPVPVNGVTDEHLRDVAKKTLGFSGREISKLMASVQSAAHGSDDGAATPEMLKTMTQFKIQEHANKTKAFAVDASKK